MPVRNVESAPNATATIARREVAIRAFDPAGSRRDSGRAVAVGVVALELTEPAADAAVLFDVRAEAVSRRAVHRGVRGAVEA